ncbi:hypothetical protein EDD15DRAFT_2165629 [Pisolithus albus]|nr:hypothetical protein EDD15DRAFT_2165629 [Pisolithus albus]
MVERHPGAGLSNVPSTPDESTPLSNITAAPGVTSPSTHPSSSTLGTFEGGVSVALPAGNKSTWAARNPGWPTAQSRQPLSAVEKECLSAHAASRQISAAQRKDRDTLLGEAIRSLADELEVKVQVIATTHNVTQEKVKKLLGGHKYYRNARSTQLANAIIHDKVHEVNEGDLSLSLQQIWDLAKVDPKYQEMTQDEKDELLHALTEYRALKNAGIRATNAAVACDVQSTLERVFKILDGLALRSGIYVCLFATCGHVYDSSQPFWYGTDNVMDFWEDVLDVEPDELTSRSATQWRACSGCVPASLILASMCTLPHALTVSHTRTGVVAKKKIRINFVNFEVSIKEKYGIDLIGWPEGVLFQSPRAIMSVEHLRTLRDALKAGMCHWAHMSRQQRLEYQDRLKERRSAGEVVGKPRKKRSDVGRKRRRTARGKGPKSTEMIDSSSGESGSTCEEDDM